MLRTLTSLDQAFAHLSIQLTDCLQRFDGYADRYSSTLAKVDACHTVWIQFHEDPARNTRNTSRIRRIGMCRWRHRLNVRNSPAAVRPVK